MSLQDFTPEDRELIRRVTGRGALLSDVPTGGLLNQELLGRVDSALMQQAQPTRFQRFMTRAAPVLRPLLYGLGGGALRDPAFGMKIEGARAEAEAGIRREQADSEDRSLRRELDQMKMDSMRRRERAMRAYEESLASGDPDASRRAAAEAFPQAYAESLFRAPPRPSPKAIVGPNNQPLYVDAPDAIGKQPYYKPGLKGQITLPDGTVVSLGDGVGTASQIHDDIAQEASLDTTLGMLGDAMKTIRSNRGATGIGGVVGKPLSGLAGGLEDVGVLPPGSGAATAQAITGSSQETLQQLTTIKEALVPALRPWMADKGPLSIQERTALQNAVGIMSATTDSRQADAALKQIVKTILGNQVRTQRGLGRPNQYDPTISDANALRLARSLRDMGFSNQEIDTFAESLGYGR